MKIRTKEGLGTGAALAATALIAAVIAWSYMEVVDANRQRQQANEIARGLTDLRMVTFEYRLTGLERARVQWHAVSERIDRLIAQGDLQGLVEKEIIDGLRKRSTVARSLFAELSSTHAAEPADAVSDESRRQFVAPLLSRLLIGQQDSFADAIRLTDLATERINAAQQRVLVVILAGLTLIATIILIASWRLKRFVLAPIVGLQLVARKVAAGEWNCRFEGDSDDEIGQLRQDLNTMTQSLQQSLAALERSNCGLATLNQEMEAFSYSVSHDLRAPLRSMDGFSLALLQDYGDRLDEEGNEFLHRIRAASQRMGQLIDDLIGLSRVTRAEFTLQPVDLSAMAREIAEGLRQEHPGRDVTVLIEDNLTLRADRSLMHRAMRNLLENAWKFTGKTEDATIRVGARQHEGKTVHYVADNGAGFDMAYADRLFTPFQRLHRTSEFPGTGIGLAIVQRIVRRHQGRIWVEAKQGEGATFLFTLGGLENG